MRNNSTAHVLCVALSAIVVAITPQTAKSEPTARSTSGTEVVNGSDFEKQLRSLETEWAAAVVKGDPDNIGRFFTDDFLFVGAGGVLQNREQHLDDFKTGKLRIASITINRIEVRLFNNFAITSTLADVAGKFDGRDITGSYRFMDTWRRSNADWLAVARQQTRVIAPVQSDAKWKAEVVGKQRAFAASRLRASETELRELSNTARDSQLELPASQRLLLARNATRTFVNPIVIEATSGTVRLEAKYGDNTIGPDNVHLRSYNGLLCGPTLKVKAGQTLKITLVNHLSDHADGPHSGNGHHGWNTTNLHLHGLHVKPQADPDSGSPPAIESDNVLIELLPTQTQEYEFEIPADHPAGTFWYHAHKHGSTSAQVASGMAGALIVTRDDDVHNLDSIPEIGAAMSKIGDHEREKILLFQQVPYIKQSASVDGHIELGDENAMFGTGWHSSGRFTTVSGQRLPVIEFAPGEIQRWRMIDGGFREELALQIVKDPNDAGPAPDHIEFKEIAVDGLALSQDLSELNPSVSTIDLFPGYRSDVLVQAPSSAGTYYLIDARSPADVSLLDEEETLKFIAKIVVTNSPAVTMSMPTPAQVGAKRLASLPLPAATTSIEQAYYGIVNGSFVIGDTDPGPAAGVNGQPYSESDTRHLTLGLVQKWRIGTRNSTGGPPPPRPRGPTHPFHIHVNPFEITSIKDPDGNETLAGPIWRDTIAMPPGYTIEFLTRYDDFRGTFVQHCHILDHEDRGMMQNITIDSASVPPGGSPLSVNSRDAVDNPSPAPHGTPAVMFFVQGSFCPQCSSQLVKMSAALAQSGASVWVVSADSEEDLKQFPDLPFKLVADPKHKLFRKYGAFNVAPLHATIVFDRTGNMVLRKIGAEPFMNVDAVRSALARDNSTEKSSENCNCAPTSSLTRVRKDIDCLTPHELEVLEHAFDIVQQRSVANPSDRTGYAWQVRIHGDRLVGPCEHNSELIWPWHRAFLYYFENLLRETDPNHPTLSTRDLTLPYWDWTKAPSGTQGYPKAYEEASSPLFHGGRNIWSSSVPPPLIAETDLGLDMPIWSDFGGSLVGPGQLENIAHYVGHVTYTGGDMASTRISVQDPIFWAHHANLDRLWDLWQQKYVENPAQQSAPLAGWPGATPVPIVSNFNDIRQQLGYDYCNPLPTRDLIVAHGANEPGSRTMSLSFRPPQNSTASAPPLPATYVRLWQVRVPTKSSYELRIFVHPKNIAFAPDDASFVGKFLANRVGMLQMDHEGTTDHGQHPATVDLRVNITRRFNELLRAATPDEEFKISVDAVQTGQQKLQKAALNEGEIGIGKIELLTSAR